MDLSSCPFPFFRKHANERKADKNFAENISSQQSSSDSNIKIESDESFASCCKDNIHASRARHYRYALLLSWLVISLLLVLDRFFTNVWPRQSFSDAPCSGNCGGDFFCSFSGEAGPPGCLRPGPWTAKTFDVIARASSRIIISTTNLMFLTVCHCTWNYLSERKHLKRFLYTWREDNLWVHRIAGWILAGWTLAHMWSLFLPSIFNGFQNVHVKGSLTWPAQITLNGPQIDVDTKEARWGSDDVSFSSSHQPLLLGFYVVSLEQTFAAIVHLR